MKMPFAALLIVFASASVVCAGDWPQWRGPQRNGQFTGPAWPDKLDASHLHQVWRVCQFRHLGLFLNCCAEAISIMH